MPKENDGADHHLTAHVGEGAILVTDEKALVEIVDASGTFQAAWVRRPNDLDDVPPCDPWGEEARAYAKGWKRGA